MANIEGSEFTVEGEDWVMWTPTTKSVTVLVDGIQIAVKSFDDLEDEGEE
jgi:hypothetical protein